VSVMMVLKPHTPQENTAGDAYAILPNHDAWCVGDKGAVVYEFAGAWGE